MKKTIKVLEAGKHIEKIIMEEAKNKNSLIYNEMSFLVGFFKIGNTPITQGIQYEIIDIEEVEKVKFELRENEIIL